MHTWITMVWFHCDFQKNRLLYYFSVWISVHHIFQFNFQRQIFIVCPLPLVAKGDLYKPYLKKRISPRNFWPNQENSKTLMFISEAKTGFKFHRDDYLKVKTNVSCLAQNRVFYFASELSNVPALRLLMCPMDEASRVHQRSIDI